MARSTPSMALALDVLTIAAIGVLAFILKNVLHEAVGHGGACLLVGGLPLELSTAHFECGYANVSDAGVRWVAAAGTLVNLAAAFVFWLAFKSSQTFPPSIRYFLWLSLSCNFFTGAGYPLFSGALGVGDWIAVLDGFQPMWLGRLLLVVVGTGLYFWGVWFTLRAIISLIGAHPTERLIRAFRLTLIPYLVGATATSIGVLFNPLGSFVMFTSTAAAFGGSSALAWMSQMLKTKWFPETSGEMVTIERNWGWVIVAGVLLAGHIFILGPMVKF